ncbi:hypothetical protein H257_18412 [Aphanomyces astaci]|uniref:Peptidase M28 domain-containing protein n=1 Tax=Aphanomyces astaci TaxID=112090 RepID=W4FB71_APHAT|nr:hypothetical protein H257_18412 [Aphanomyces astaci]ETV64750.1 hypothetical protein H257_18412 [Aphanomyces astaci]|eukprot:XP_009845761.1 hypothetical protein H257_18412 [Aphanomyces astaci]
MPVHETSPYPTVATYPKLVHGVTAKIQITDLKQSLESFVNKYANRLFNSTEGGQSWHWIYDQAVELASTEVNNTNVKVTVRPVTHEWGQYSVIARVEPTTIVKDDIVILSAHLDTINDVDWNDTVKRYIAPGADDDGSGTVTILKTLKYLLTAPIRPVEFHWYSAEEFGLQGTKAVAEEYANASTAVYALMQLDMTGLVATYVGLRVNHSACGYNCSDHYSWNISGYPSSFPFETELIDLNPNYHSQNDTVDTIIFQHGRFHQARDCVRCRADSGQRHVMLITSLFHRSTVHMGYR